MACAAVRLRARMLIALFMRVKEKFQTQTPSPSSSSSSSDFQTDEILTDFVARIGFTIKGGENIQIRRLSAPATKTLLIHLLSSLLPGGPGPTPSNDLEVEELQETELGNSTEPCMISPNAL